MSEEVLFGLPPKVPLSGGIPHQYSFYCKDCDIKWRDTTLDSSCWGCEKNMRTAKLKASEKMW